ncbi:MAG: aminotransferase class IV family protein [Candidatus Omnitrophica bacterium]|nr:aminotransferase class IV family protein [Candidatus Omnitrophota bacterium]
MPRVVEPRAEALPHEAASNGCFETMRAYGGRIFRLDAHLERLYASAQFLGTRPPDRARLRGELVQALSRSRLQEAVVRVALLPRRDQPAQPSVVVQAASVLPASAYRSGIRASVVPARKFSVGSIDPRAKYSARLGSVLAVADSQLRGVDEALFMDALGGVTESTASNLGAVSRGVILTPPCWLGLLAGITRDVLFAAPGVPPARQAGMRQSCVRRNAECVM